MSKTQV